ncbi:MAG: YcaQ family DNA glycosylase [Acidimicrobiia bacterium]|nr:YcaQ family DNA glycosylase [Acidimicrobiia bacterium]
MSHRTITIARARRLALGAQGFARPRPSGRIGSRHLLSTLERMGLVQLDSVNVLARSHHLPFFSRLGAYDRDRLDDLLWRSRQAFEYVGHEAAVMPIDQHPLMRHRMAGHHRWRRAEQLEAARPGFLDAIMDEIAERGPLSATDLSDGGSRTGPWWGLSPGKVALQALYATGRLAIADRRPNFVTTYDFPERVIPPSVLAEPTPDPHEAARDLLRIAVRAIGIGTLADIADHHRQKAPPARAALADLLAEGVVEEVRVEGWRDPAYLDTSAVVPRRIDARALLSPFDPVVWFRPRVERLFGFHYRIEIYVPEPKRVHGYYVLPFLLGDRLVGRVDLKADRAAGRLRVRGAYAEDHASPHEVAPALADELFDMARWLGLDDVVVEPNGALSAHLADAIDAAACPDTGAGAR